jgi:formate hydrogenlyase subunit 3/multisubunit Na+/H+ antiporter MnhD subunit
MERSRPHGQRGILAGPGAERALSALLLALCLLISLPSFAATDNGKTVTYEDRATAEKRSRSRYRNLEVASLVVILVAGGAAILWAVRRRKP